jgi:RNase P subunit RPR2
MTPAAATARRSLCPTCHRRTVRRRIEHPAGTVLRCPLCGSVHAVRRERWLAAV